MKKILPLLVLAALVLSACSSATPKPLVSTPTSKPAVTATTAPAAAAPTVTPLPGGCQPAALLPDPDPAFPAITKEDWSKGPETASVTILEYSDFQCPYCAFVVPVMEQLLKKYPQDFRVVFRHFPLNIHDKAILSAQAAEAAGLQGKFWEMHDLLMTKQGEWEAKTLADFETYLRTLGGSVSGLDVNKFMTDLKSELVVKKVAAALDSAEKIGLDRTPFLVINGRAFDGNPDEPTLDYIINLFKSVRAIESKRFKACPPMAIDKAKQYTATLATSKGDIVIQLYADKAPLTVNSFVFLAKNGWFDNVPFHRVVADFVVQSGDPSGTGIGNPGYQYNNEIAPGLSYDKAGVVGMANAGPNTNGSQFFITLSPQTQLTGSYTIFGQVTQGLDVLQKLTVRDPSTTIPADTISKVTISEK